MPEWLDMPNVYLDELSGYFCYEICGVYLGHKEHIWEEWFPYFAWDFENEEND